MEAFQQEKNIWREFMTTGDYPKGRGATVFSFLIREKMLDVEEIVTKIFPLSLRMKREMSDSLCWAQLQDSPEHRVGDSCPGAPGSALSWLHC